MKSQRVLCLAGCGVLMITAVYAFQKPFRQYPPLEGQYDIVELPPDYAESTEWVFARLMYPNHPEGLFGSFGRRGRFGGLMMDWRDGATSWTQDYPRADRHFASAVRRLTRIHARSAEQPSNPDDVDDFYNWPWLAAGEMGDWKLTEAQAKTLREYLLRGGFLMLDDFWGAEEYGRFAESMNRVFPDRPVVELDSKDAIFHSVYDLDDRFQILGTWAMPGWGRGGGGGMAQRAYGTKAHWMGVYDDRQRVMVAISFNSDIGDSWEWADDPRYPQEMAALGIRIGVNYVVYAMTH
jgi:hypothetical protein